jgi:type I restriction enzyme S subunit
MISKNKLLENPNWKKVKLGELIEDIGDGGTPSTKNKEYFNGEIPWVNIEDIQKNIYNTRRKLSKEGLNNCSAKLWEPGTVIFSFGATIGEVGIARVQLCTKQGIAGIIPKKERLDSEYLYYSLKKLASRIKQIGTSMGSTIKEVRPPLLKKIVEISIPYPDNPKKSLREQQRIAEILSTIDKKIELEQKKKEKMERIKKGLMNDLLTGNKRVNVENVLKIGGEK